MLRLSFKILHKNYFVMRMLVSVVVVLAAVSFILKPDFIDKIFAIPTDQATVILSTWALPTTPKNISNIISDFGGNAYFAESDTNKIGRLEPATNLITQWTLPTNSIRPAGIEFDPASGSVYFAESNTNKIGRFVPIINVITEWNINSNPLDISVTPGGSIYFVDDLGRIGRLG